MSLDPEFDWPDEDQAPLSMLEPVDEDPRPPLTPDDLVDPEEMCGDTDEFGHVCCELIGHLSAGIPHWCGMAGDDDPATWGHPDETCGRQWGDEYVPVLNVNVREGVL